MTAFPICAILVHVPNVTAALAWYQRAFPLATARRIAEFKFDYLEYAGVRIELVPSDEKVSSGPAGSIVYWSVADLEQALAHFLAIGATLYRGPMAIEDGQHMCQVRDPWGNCIGLRG